MNGIGEFLDACDAYLSVSYRIGIWIIFDQKELISNVLLQTSSKSLQFFFVIPCRICNIFTGLWCK